MAEATQTWSERLAELGIVLPAVAAPVAAYVPAVRSGNHVYTSGQLPFVDGKLALTGKLGAGVSDEDAKPRLAPARSTLSLPSTPWSASTTSFVSSRLSASWHPPKDSPVSPA